MSTSRQKLVFILGMHRSGTSLAAEIVSEMGFSVPGEMLDVVESINAHGFWESREVVDFNESFLGSCGKKWFDLGIFSDKKIHKPFGARCRRAIEGFLNSSFISQGDLVIKDPRLCIFWPFWLSNIDRSKVDVKVIFVNRQPLSVANSIAVRDGFSVFSGVFLWLEYVFSALSHVD